VLILYAVTFVLSLFLLYTITIAFLFSAMALLYTAENKNAIVAFCWTYFTTIKH